MEKTMNTSLAQLEAEIIALGIFVIFLVTFADYVLKKIAPIIRGWFSQDKHLRPD
jgi:hypothetical protein